MTVYVLYNTDSNAGYIAGVFSTYEKLAEYVSKNTYSSFIITEHEVDKLYKASKVKVVSKDHAKT